VWSDPAIAGPLAWYRAVAVNAMPAKYLIARRIPVALEGPEPLLWEELERATASFLTLWQAVRQGEPLPAPAASPTLVDLRAAPARQLAGMAWMLRSEGCHNVNFVGGEVTIHLHTILEAIAHLGEPPAPEDIPTLLRTKADRWQQWDVVPEAAAYRGEFNVPVL